MADDFGTVGATLSLDARATVAYDLTTLANVKSYIGLTVKDDDTLLTRLIGVASAWVRNYIDHDVFPVKSYSETVVGKGKGDLIWLAEWPVASVTSLTVEDGTVIPARVGSADGYWLENPNILHLHGYTIGRGQHATVVYSAGWDAVPPEIEQACIDITLYEYKRRTRVAQNSKNLPGETVQFDMEWASKYAREILSHWKRVVPRVRGLT